jgi:hypothetical protein
MGHHHAKLTDNEKICDLECIVSGNKAILTPCSRAMFALDKLCEKNQLTKDVASVIMRYYYLSLAGDRTDSRRFGLKENGFLGKPFKFSLSSLTQQPLALVSSSDIPESVAVKLGFQIHLFSSVNTVRFTGTIKGIPSFSRGFDLDCSALIAAISPKNSNSETTMGRISLSGANDVEYDANHVYDTDLGIEMYTMKTLLFLYDNIYMRSRIK